LSTTKTTRREAGLRTRMAMEKSAMRHARLTLLAAARAATDSPDPIAAADARTTIADCHAALDDLRGITR
jgi:hypothetical protein